MTNSTLTRTTLSLAVATLVAACGGGESPRSAADDFVASYQGMGQPSDRLFTAAGGSGGGRSGGAATTITNAQLFQGAEVIFPDLFPTRSAPVNIENLAFQGKIFQVRGYSNGNYLGIGNDGRLYGLGPYTNGQLTDFGVMQSFGDLVCSRINCGSGTGTGSGALNDCAMPASQALVTGNRVNLVYAYSGIITGEQSVQSVVDGAASFRGQSAVQSTATTTGTNSVTQGGFTLTITTTTRSRSYSQASNNGLVKTLGALIDVTTSTPFPSLPGLPTLPPTVTTISSETFYNPASENIEFTLAQGQSLNKTETSTTTVTAGPGAGSPQTVTGTTTHAFEARESVTVQAGTFNTCRYRVTDAGGTATTSWFIVGKGIAAKSQSVTPQGTQTVELKSGTFNGQRL